MSAKRQQESVLVMNEEEVLIRHTLAWAETRGTNAKHFGEILIARLKEVGLAPEEPKTGKEYTTWIGTVRRRVSRIFNRISSIPLAWKWHWVECLPESYQDACRSELAAFTGSLHIPLPCHTTTRMPASSRLAQVTKEFSEVVAASSLAHDGFDPTDDTGEAAEYMSQLMDLLQETVREMFAVQQGTGIISQRQLIALLSNELGQAET